MIRTVGFALMLLILTSASLDGQRRSDKHEPDEGPVRALIEIRERLALTDDQVARLTSLDADMNRRNEPYVRRLMEVRRSIRALGHRRDFSAEQRAQYELYISEAKPLMKQIRENNHEAMREVGVILTDVQKRQVAEILRDRDHDGDRDRRDGSQDRRGNG